MFEINCRMYFVLFCVILVISLVVQTRIWGGVARSDEWIHDRILFELDSTFSQPNPWNYVLGRSTSYETKSLAYSVSGFFVVCHKGTTDADKAMRLFFPIYGHFIRKCNETRRLRPFLNTFPLTPDQAELCLRFDENFEEICAPPKISNVYLNGKGVILLSIHAPLRCAYYTDIAKIPVKEVPEIAQYYQKGCPRKAIEPKPPLEFLQSVYLDYPGEKGLLSFLKEYCNGINLGVLAVGRVGPTWEEESVYGFALVGRQLMSFEEARKIASVCAKDTFEFIRHDKECLKQIDYQSALKFPIHPSATPVPEHFAFRIAFWDENIDRPIQPYIAEIRYFNGVFKYYTADEVQRLVLVHEETFDEAMKFLEQATVAVK